MDVLIQHQIENQPLFPSTSLPTMLLLSIAKWKKFISHDDLRLMCTPSQSAVLYLFKKLFHTFVIGYLFAVLAATGSGGSRATAPNRAPAAQMNFHEINVTLWNLMTELIRWPVAEAATANAEGERERHKIIVVMKTRQIINSVLRVSLFLFGR